VTRGVLPLLLCLILCVPLTSQAVFTDNQLQGELWMTLQPILPQELERRAHDKEKLDALLKEMTAVFSGMIYGWSFDYRPIAPDRNVPEKLDVVPLGHIVGTTGNVKTSRAWAWATHLNDETGILVVDFRYIMTPFEVERRSAWASANMDTAVGRGRAPLVDRWESRLDALHQALKDAVRNLLRPQYYNRPEEIRGEAILAQVPLYGVDSGQYTCSARFQIRIFKVRDYPSQ